jgi:hypothetical protein
MEPLYRLKPAKTTYAIKFSENKDLLKFAMVLAGFSRLRARLVGAVKEQPFVTVS